MTKEEREFAAKVQKAHLLTLFTSFMGLSADCDDPLLQSLILSILPAMHFPDHKKVLQYSFY